MIARIIARIIGGVGSLALLLAFFLLYRDLSKALGGAAIHITTLGDLWSAVHPTSLQSLQPVIERHVAECRGLRPSCRCSPRRPSGRSQSPAPS